jgi:hypothetical protein
MLLCLCISSPSAAHTYSGPFLRCDTLSPTLKRDESLALRAGGVVVLSGAGCEVQFDDVTFDDTMLVVMDGAEAKITDCRFLAQGEHSEHIHMYVDGADTRVELVDTKLEGGKQGIAVHHGTVSMSMSHSLFRALLSQCKWMLECF